MLFVKTFESRFVVMDVGVLVGVIGDGEVCDCDEDRLDEVL